jgi:hypothetical protein
VRCVAGPAGGDLVEELGDACVLGSPLLSHLLLLGLRIVPQLRQLLTVLPLDVLRRGRAHGVHPHLEPLPHLSTTIPTTLKLRSSTKQREILVPPFSSPTPAASISHRPVIPASLLHFSKHHLHTDYPPDTSTCTAGESPHHPTELGDDGGD